MWAPRVRSRSIFLRSEVPVGGIDGIAGKSCMAGEQDVYELSLNRCGSNVYGCDIFAAGADLDDVRGEAMNYPAMGLEDGRIGGFGG